MRFQYIILLAGLCQMLSAAEDSQTQKESEIYIADSSIVDSENQDPWQILAKPSTKPVSIVFTTKPEETLRDGKANDWIYPDKEVNQKSREKYKILENLVNVESLVFLGAFHLHDFLNYQGSIDSQLLFSKAVRDQDGNAQKYVIKPLDEWIQETPHLKCLKTVRHIYIENLVSSHGYATAGFFQNFLPMLPNLEEIVCGGICRIDFNEDGALGRLGETLKGGKLKKATFGSRHNAITFERKKLCLWTAIYGYTKGAGTPMSEEALMKSLKRKLGDS